MSDVTCKELIDAVRGALGKIAVEVHTKFKHVTIIAPRERIVDVMQRLRQSELTEFHQLMDVCGIDFPDRALRFNVAYQLLSLSHNWRLTVIVATEEGKAVPSVTSVYPAANWFEREAYDMYGIEFSGHPDLRRILTDYDFEGYPLRRDFPLSGHTQVRYDDLTRKVVHEPVDLEEPMRDYDTVSTWKGVADVQKRGGDV